MGRKLFASSIASIAVALSVGGASAAGIEAGHTSFLRPSAVHRAAGVREETLWIFDADFEDLTGDNAGWITYDRSGTIAQTNHWHHDTIRINGFEYLGDSTWWCGTYNDCWRQPRGYGNNWYQILERHFDEHVGVAGSSLILEYDQRLAMEKDYDYGYVDIFEAVADSWRTVVTVDNPGFAGTPGISQDWNSINPLAPGHMTVDISDYLGTEFDLRFRFESDMMCSSQDSYDSPPASPFLDGAWQLDNITLYVDTTPVFYDDAESGDPWIHDDVIASGQTGVTFWRGQYGIDFVTGREFSCDEPPVGSWMYAAVDPFTSTLVDDERAWLMSPPIDISGATRLVGCVEGWTDAERQTGDFFKRYLATSDIRPCVEDPDSFVGELGWIYTGPQWWVDYRNWDAFCGTDWLGILWAVANLDPAAEPHMGGLFIDRQRVGIPSGDPGTVWERDDWRRFNDWFQDQLDEALSDTAVVTITDSDGITSAYIVASGDGGQTWQSYAMRREGEGSNRWLVPPPADQMTPGSEVLYYYEATNGVGNVSTYPAVAPDRTFEMSILPITASITEPGMLLVDKCGGGTTGARRHRPPYLQDPQDPAADAELRYRGALEALGYGYDVYDVEAPAQLSSASDGPDVVGMKYYDTQIWFTGHHDSQTLTPIDQLNLIQWLNESSEGKERNLLLTGDDIGKELVGGETETLGFYCTWLASQYIDDAVGVVTIDSVPGLEDHAGDGVFMNHDDGECILGGGCPWLHYFDVIQPASGSVGAETVADYVRTDAERRSAGVAYTHQTMGYQTVNLGFGMECMMDGTVDGGSANYTPEGYYHDGAVDRANLMQNIMDYFGKTPSGPATGVPEANRRNELSYARPNPLNPATTISYAVKDAGWVTIRVYNVAGRVVRTLLESELPAGTSGHVAWNGTDEAGETCAGGVYFYRISAPGFASSRKMVLLR